VREGIFFDGDGGDSKAAELRDKDDDEIRNKGMVDRGIFEEGGGKRLEPRESTSRKAEGAT